MYLLYVDYSWTLYDVDWNHDLNDDDVVVDGDDDGDNGDDVDKNNNGGNTVVLDHDNVMIVQFDHLVHIDY